jgi:hypothetical protein
MTAPDMIPFGFKPMAFKPKRKAETETGVYISLTYIGLSTPLYEALDAPYVTVLADDTTGRLYLEGTMTPSAHTLKRSKQIGSTTLNKWLAAHGYQNRTFYRVMGYGTGFLLSPNNARS